MLKRFFTFTFAFQMTSVDACGVTLVFKHNYLPLLTGVLNLQIGFASPKMTVNLYIYIYIYIYQDTIFILYVKDDDMDN